MRIYRIAAPALVRACYAVYMLAQAIPRKQLHERTAHHAKHERKLYRASSRTARAQAINRISTSTATAQPCKRMHATAMPPTANVLVHNAH